MAIELGDGNNPSKKDNKEGLFVGQGNPGNSKDAYTSNGSDFFDKFSGTENAAMSDPFGLGFFLGATDGSEYVKEFTDALKDKDFKISKNGIDIKTTILKMDRSLPQFNYLYYSAIVVVTEFSNTDDLFSHIILLEATGEKPKQVATMLDDYRNKQQPQALYVPSDAFDPILADGVKNTIKIKFGDRKVVSTNGMLIPYNIPAKAIADKAIMIAINANLTRYATKTGLVPTLSLPKFLADTSNSIIEQDITYITSRLGHNYLGAPIRTDFRLDISQASRSNNSKYLNSKSSRVPIVSASGYLEFLPHVEQGNHMMPEKRSVLPAIIINDIASPKPSLDMMILGILSGTVFSNPDHLATLLTSGIKDPGMMNYIVNIENNKSGYGDRIKLIDGKNSREAVMEGVSKLVTPTPVLFVEAEVYGPNCDPMTPWIMLASGQASHANNLIISELEKMLGTKLNTRRVMVSKTNTIPLGTFVSSDGVERDIRDIDLAYVIEHAKDHNLILQWISSNAPGVGGVNDGYYQKLEVINALAPNAIITGKAIRVAINPELIAEVVSIMAQIGFSPKIDANPTASFARDNNLFQISAAYANAGISGVSYGQAFGNTNSTYYPGHLDIFGKQF